MKDCKLLFEENNITDFNYKIKKNLKLRDKRLVYTMDVGGLFNGDHILEIISVVNYVKKYYRQKIPITIYAGEFEFYDTIALVV